MLPPNHSFTVWAWWILTLSSWIWPWCVCLHSIQFNLYSAIHNTHHFKAALQMCMRPFYNLECFVIRGNCLSYVFQKCTYTKSQFAKNVLMKKRYLMKIQWSHWSNEYLFVTKWLWHLENIVLVHVDSELASSEVFTWVGAVFL